MTMKRVAVTLLGVNAVLLVDLLLAGRAAIAQAVSPLIRARAIELVDDRGTDCCPAQRGAGRRGCLRLRDATGTIRVKIGASEEGSGLVLLDEATEPGVHMIARRAGTSVTLK